MDIRMINVLVLAYLGDSVYENLVRDYLISLGINNVNDLQKRSLNFVSAKSQAKLLNCLIEDNVLFEEELDVVKRARNAKTNSKPKSCDVVTYKHATGFEALFGYLYLNNNKKRINEIFDIVKEIEKC